MSPRLVLGLGGTVDYEIDWDSSVLAELAEGFSISVAELDPHLPIESERDLVISILGYLARGYGGERFVATSDIIERFAARFRKQITVGGTCVRAAMAMSVFELDSIVHLVCIDDHIRQALPERCGYICSADHDSTDPHLIIQFAAGASVHIGDVELRAEHPNRLIYTNDPPNRELAISPELGAALESASLFMVSGFNTIQDPDLLEDRLETVIHHMERLPPGTPVFYEDAGFHLPEFSLRVRAAMAEVVDVYSMNEDELQGHLGRQVDLLDPAAVGRALDDIRALVPAPVIVVHTKFWSIAAGTAPHRYRHALDAAITMATTRYRIGDGFTLDDLTATRGLPRHEDGAMFCAAVGAHASLAVECVPAHSIHVEKPTMIGLGDTFVGGFVADLARNPHPEGDS